MLSIEYSSPAGKKVLDDFKTKIGVQVRVLKIDNICVSAKINGVFRKLDDPLVKIVNFGSEFSTTVGYYKPRWYVAGEAGFDKAIATHFKHSDLFKEYFAGVKNGWYQPATGGNFYFGVQTGVSFKNIDSHAVMHNKFKVADRLYCYHASRGKWIKKEIGKISAEIIASFHPAFLMRQPEQKKYSWEDLKMIRKKVSELKIKLNGK